GLPAAAARLLPRILQSRIQGEGHARVSRSGVPRRRADRVPPKPADRRARQGHLAPSPVRCIPLGVALVAAGLYLVGLGAAPFLDPPEGFHAAIAREMALARDWVHAARHRA